MIGRRDKRGGRSRLLFVGAGAALVRYFTDPDQGARRRNVARDRFLAFFRRRGREASRQARYAAGVASGAVQEARSKVTPDEARGKLDDVTLARKVETEIFRDADVPKGTISVNAVDGVVWLRGEASTPEMINELASKAEKVPEVRKVENLLHLPGTPAPTRTDTPETHRQDPGTDAISPEEPVTPTPMTEERRAEGAEPSPAEKAAAGGGRQAAPMGSEGEGGGRGRRRRSKS
jgi:hypothetical protein